MRYRTIEADSREQLENDVNRLLGEGWQPQGGLCVVYSPDSGKWWYYQALVWIEDR